MKKNVFKWRGYGCRMLGIRGFTEVVHANDDFDGWHRLPDEDEAHHLRLFVTRLQSHLEDWTDEYGYGHNFSVDTDGTYAAVRESDRWTYVGDGLYQHNRNRCYVLRGSGFVQKEDGSIVLRGFVIEANVFTQPPVSYVNGSDSDEETPTKVVFILNLSPQCNTAYRHGTMNDTMYKMKCVFCHPPAELSPSDVENPHWIAENRMGAL